MEQKESYRGLFDFNVDWSDKSVPLEGSLDVNKDASKSGDEHRIKPTEGEIDAFLENLKESVPCGTLDLEGNSQSCIPVPLDSSKSSGKAISSENIVISFSTPDGTRDVNISSKLISSDISGPSERSNRSTVSYKPDGSLLKTIHTQPFKNFMENSTSFITNRVESSPSNKLLCVTLEQNEDIGGGISHVKEKDLNRISSRPRVSLNNEPKHRVKRSPEHSKLDIKSYLEAIQESTFSRERTNSRREVFIERASRDRRRGEDRKKERSRSRSPERRRVRSRTPSHRKFTSHSSYVPRNSTTENPVRGGLHLKPDGISNNTSDYFPSGSSIKPQEPSSTLINSFTNPPNMAYRGPGEGMMPFLKGNTNDGSHVNYPSYNAMPSQPPVAGNYQSMQGPYSRYPLQQTMYPVPQSYGAYAPTQPASVRLPTGQWGYSEPSPAYPHMPSMAQRKIFDDYSVRKRSQSPNRMQRTIPRDISQYGDMENDNSPSNRRYRSSSSPESIRSHKRKSKRHSRSPDIYKFKESKNRRSKSSDSWHETEKRPRMGSSVESRKRSSNDYDSRLKTNFDPNRIPTPPPPPILSHDQSNSKYQSRAKSRDDLSSALDKESLSLSCLLEEVMETSGQGKSQVSDPKVKNEILAHCETKIRQLYKRRNAGMGAFVPDAVKNRLVHAQGSPLITYHPHLPYNEGPEETRWKCPGIKVPHVRKILPGKPAPISVIEPQNRAVSPVTHPETNIGHEKPSYGTTAENTNLTGVGSNASLTYPGQAVSQNYWGGNINTDVWESKSQPVDNMYQQPKLISYPQHLMGLKNVTYPLDIKPNYVTQEVMQISKERRSRSPTRYNSMLLEKRRSHSPAAYNAMHREEKRSRSPSRRRKKSRSNSYSERKDSRSSRKSKKKKKKRSSSRSRRKRDSLPRRHESPSRYTSPVKYDVARPDPVMIGYPMRYDVYKPETSSGYEMYRPVPPANYDLPVRYAVYRPQTSVNYNSPVKYDAYRPAPSTTYVQHMYDANRPDSSGMYQTPRAAPFTKKPSTVKSDLETKKIEHPKTNFIQLYNKNLITLVTQDKDKSVEPKPPGQKKSIPNKSEEKSNRVDKEMNNDVIIIEDTDLRDNVALSHMNNEIKKYEKSGNQINKKRSNNNIIDVKLINKDLKSEIQEDLKLPFDRICSLGPDLRKIQEKSLLYGVMISSLEKKDKAYKKLYTIKNTALFKKNPNSAHSLKLVVPRDFVKEVLTLLHNKFHDISQSEMLKSLENVLYPWGGNVPKAMSTVFKECPTCKLQPRKIEPLVDKTVERKQNNKTEKNDVTKNVKCRSPPDVKNEETSKKRDTSFHLPSSQKHYSNRNSKYHDVKGPKDKSDGAPCGYEKATKSRISVIKEVNQNVENPSKDDVGKSVKDSLTLKLTNLKAEDVSAPLQQPQLPGTATSEEQSGILKSSPSTTNVLKTTENKIPDGQKTVPYPPTAAASATGKNPVKENKDKNNESNLGFKTLVRNVQMKEYGEIILSIESGDKSKNLDEIYVLKGGMLCKKLTSSSGLEVKIIAPLSEVDEIISIVHKMSSVHTPAQKTILFFNKHFTPIEDIENKVHEFVKNCDKCQN